MREPTVSISNIKYDLIKIIEPWDGILMRNQSEPVYRLFVSYLNDLRKEGKLREFNVSSKNRETAITYDVAIKFSNERSPKKLKIHVGVFEFPWTKGGPYAQFANN